MDEDHLYCSLCLDGVIFKNLKQMRKHYKVFHTDCKKQCHECYNRFKTQELLATHIAEEHGIPMESKRIFCVHCNDKTFMYSFGLVSHSNRIHPKYKYRCFKCLNSFFTDAILGEHAQVHKDASKDPFVIRHGGSE